jgi:stage II sporulation SpoAA-like protein
MSAKIVGIDSDVVTVQIAGRLLEREFTALQQEVGRIISGRGRTRLLVLVEEFEGWEPKVKWGDFSFQLQHDANIDRMAIVGDRKWADLALLFATQGLRPFPIEYFDTLETARAKAWLEAAAT